MKRNNHRDKRDNEVEIFWASVRGFYLEEKIDKKEILALNIR